MAGPKYASGKYAIAECDRCGQRVKLKELKKLVVRTKQINIKVCHECWEYDHPQLRLGMYPVYDPQAVLEPRPDVSYDESGTSLAGLPGEGSRVVQWGWNPVGGARSVALLATPNDLAPVAQIGTVTITTA